MKVRSHLTLLALPLAVLAIALGSTAAVWRQTKGSVEGQERERFAAAADRLQDSIQERLETYVAILRTATGLFAASGHVTREEFHAFVEQLGLRQRYPGIQGIGYTARIPAASLATAVAAHRRAGAPNFEVWPGGVRREYHSILYLEPFDRRNRAAIGYDMFTEPTRRAAMEAARDSAQPAASGIVTLVQEIDEDKQPGFLIYVPVYDSAVAPQTVEERRAKLQGFVYSPFRAGDLFAGILGSNARPRAGFELYDGDPSAERLLHRTAIAGQTGRLTARRTITVAGRRWAAEIFSAPALDETSNRGLLPIVLWTGGTVTTVLTVLTLLQVRARRRAEESEKAAADASHRLQQLANSIPQLAWMARPDGFVFWYNERWYEYTGTAPGDMHGWGWQSVHDPDALPRVVERWASSLQTGEPFEMEFPLRRADGQWRLFLTRVVPFRDSSGRIAYWFGTNTDVQYRHDAERALQEQAETLAIVNQSGTQLAAELDLDRLVQAVTDAGTRLSHAQFGAFFYNQVNEHGESYTLYALSGASREAFEPFAMPRNTAVFGPTFRGEAIIRADDITADPRYGQNAPHHGMPAGHLPVRSYLAAAVKARSGEVIGGLFFGHADAGVFTAQTEHIIRGIAAQAAIAIDNARLYRQVHRLLDSERAARSEAERVNRLKDEFLATLSHELRTPLNAVVGWAYILSSGPLTDEKRAVAIESILRNARSQSQLTDDLLDMSRIISGRVRMESTILDVGEVIDAAMNVVRPTAEAKRVALSLVAAADVHRVHADPNRLQQVLWNLLTNAIKFTPPGGAVTVTLRRSETEVEIAVSDNGIGIEPDFLPFVFDRFRQADGSFTRTHGGLGLGLSIVRSLVEMHAGTIRAESQGQDQGATFTVCFPAAADVPGAVDVVKPAHQAAVDPATDGLRDVTVLLVDDDADALALTEELLQQEGARTVTATSGAEALRQLTAGAAPVALVISDLGMPQMDGLELIRHIRALPPERGGAAAAIALTAYACADDQRGAIAAGFDAHLAKPFTPGALIAACTALVRNAAASERRRSEPVRGPSDSGHPRSPRSAS